MDSTQITNKQLAIVIRDAENTVARMLEDKQSKSKILIQLEYEFEIPMVLAEKIYNSTVQILKENKEKKAKQETLLGILFFVGGIMLTELGYVSWGLIIFGGIRFLRGLKLYSEID